MCVVELDRALGSSESYQAFHMKLTAEITGGHLCIFSTGSTIGCGEEPCGAEHYHSRTGGKWSYADLRRVRKIVDVTHLVA